MVLIHIFQDGFASWESPNLSFNFWAQTLNHEFIQNIFLRKYACVRTASVRTASSGEKVKFLYLAYNSVSSQTSIGILNWKLYALIDKPWNIPEMPSHKMTASVWCCRKWNFGPKMKYALLACPHVPDWSRITGLKAPPRPFSMQCLK